MNEVTIANITNDPRRSIITKIEYDKTTSTDNIAGVAFDAYYMLNNNKYRIIGNDILKNIVIASYTMIAKMIDIHQYADISNIDDAILSMRYNPMSLVVDAMKAIYELHTGYNVTKNINILSVIPLYLCDIYRVDAASFLE